MTEFPEFPGALDYKLCPLTPQLLGCVCRGEVWVMDSATGVKHQMTSVTTGEQLNYRNLLLQCFVTIKHNYASVAKIRLQIANSYYQYLYDITIFRPQTVNLEHKLYQNFSSFTKVFSSQNVISMTVTILGYPVANRVRSIVQCFLD